jgi:hypothetical protein
MRKKPSGDRSKIILEIEAHRQSRRIGGETEYEKAHALRQIGAEIRDRPSRAHRLKNGPDLLRLDGFICPVSPEQRGEDAFCLLGRRCLGRIRPENRRSVADLDAMAAA